MEVKSKIAKALPEIKNTKLKYPMFGQRARNANRIITSPSRDDNSVHSNNSKNFKSTCEDFSAHQSAVRFSTQQSLAKRSNMIRKETDHSKKPEKFNKKVSENYMHLYTSLSLNINDIKIKEQLIKRKFDSIFQDTITNDDEFKYEPNEESFITKNKLPASTKDWMPYYPCLDKQDMHMIKQLKDILTSYKDNKNVYNIIEKDTNHKSDQLYEIKKYLRRLYKKKVMEEEKFLPVLNLKSRFNKTKEFSGLFTEKKFDNKTFINNLYNLCFDSDNEAEMKPLYQTQIINPSSTQALLNQANVNQSLVQAPMSTITSINADDKKNNCFKSPEKTTSSKLKFSFKSSVKALNLGVSQVESSMSPSPYKKKMPPLSKSKKIKLKIGEFEKKIWEKKNKSFRLFEPLKLNASRIEKLSNTKNVLLAPNSIRKTSKRNENSNINSNQFINTQPSDELNQKKSTSNFFKTSYDEIIRMHQAQHLNYTCNCDEEYYNPLNDDHSKSAKKMHHTQYIKNTTAVQMKNPRERSLGKNETVKSYNLHTKLLTNGLNFTNAASHPLKDASPSNKNLVKLNTSTNNMLKVNPGSGPLHSNTLIYASTAGNLASKKTENSTKRQVELAKSDSSNMLGISQSLTHRTGEKKRVSEKKLQNLKANPKLGKLGNARKKKSTLIKIIKNNPKLLKMIDDDYKLQEDIDNIKTSKCSNLTQYNNKIYYLLQNRIEFKYLVELKKKLDLISKINSSSKIGHTVGKILNN